MQSVQVAGLLDWVHRYCPVDFFLLEIARKSHPAALVVVQDRLHLQRKQKIKPRPSNNLNVNCFNRFTPFTLQNVNQIVEHSAGNCAKKLMYAQKKTHKDFTVGEVLYV